MGGALFELGRLPAKEYIEVEQRLKSYFDSKYGPAAYRIPRFYSNKPDFGDVDILLSKNVQSDWSNKEQIVSDLGVTQYKQERNILSLAFEDKIQVDVSIIPEDMLQTTWQFLCYNDLGNILGKIFRRFNLKYGEFGIAYVFRREKDQRYKKDIILTKSMEDILRFLELSYDKWVLGFESLEEMFNWVINSPYFTVVPFIKLTTNTKKRAKLRTTISKFITYINENKIEKAYPFESDRSVYFDKICQFFSDVPLVQIIENEKLVEERENIIKNKFNGRIIMDLFPELKQAALGKFISSFKSGFENFDEEIYHMPAEDVVNKIKEFYASNK